MLKSSQFGSKGLLLLSSKVDVASTTVRWAIGEPYECSKTKMIINNSFNACRVATVSYTPSCRHTTIGFEDQSHDISIRFDHRRNGCLISTISSQFCCSVPRAGSFIDGHVIKSAPGMGLHFQKGKPRQKK